jgi:uncharacterized protein (DUF2235 family)
MSKHIVICCDGTGNEFGDTNSNVVRLYQALARDQGPVAAYYHPGVGTMGAKNALTVGGKAWTKFRGLAFGYGLSENIADAYRFLMHAFEPGDKVFVFGFSRGAYTARALCAMLQMFGLLAPGNEGLIPYAIRLFKRRDRRWLAGLHSSSNKFRTSAAFKKTFCRECRPHFLGLWDTVSSVGWILDPIGLKPGTLPFTFDLGEVATIRHAVAVDERRAFYRTNLVREQPGRDIKQVWFPGVHSDVGGGYPEGVSGLGKISLRWMFREAAAAGLPLDAQVVAKLLGETHTHAPPQSTATLHNSLTPPWWPAEIWPKMTKRRISAPGEEPARFRGRPRLNLFRRRFMPDGSSIHESVFSRKQRLPRYAPGNLPSAYAIEREPVADGYPIRLQPGQSTIAGIHARATWNDTAVQVRAGERYRFAASGRWYDATISSGPAGYASPSIAFRAVERLRRVRHANWFALIGAIGQDDTATFVIGEGTELVATADGIVSAFANDLPFLYRNNSGAVRLTITRLA